MMKVFEAFGEETGGEKTLVFGGQPLDAILNPGSSRAIGALSVPKKPDRLMGARVLGAASQYVCRESCLYVNCNSRIDAAVLALDHVYVPLHACTTSFSAKKKKRLRKALFP
jgi:hypothetical protein